MRKVDLIYLRDTLKKYGSNLENISVDMYPEVKVNKEGTSLVDVYGNNIGTKGDMYQKIMLDKILQEGCLDKNPRPVYTDSAPAHTLSINDSFSFIYDLSKGESPLVTLRPIATKSAIGEILWIYQKESNDLEVLKDNFGVTWWDEWDLGNRTIGAVYGETVRRHELVKNLIEGIEKNPDGRRHIISLWQEDDFKEPHGLKPCAFLTQWNVRHGRDGKDYLDLTLVQRSSDFCTAGCINQVQYTAFLYFMAKHLGYNPGFFVWKPTNVQIYDRHINQAIELLYREPVSCNPKFVVNSEKNNFYDFTQDDIKMDGYPRQLIKEKNPQLNFPLGI